MGRMERFGAPRCLWTIFPFSASQRIAVFLLLFASTGCLVKSCRQSRVIVKQIGYNYVQFSGILRHQFGNLRVFGQEVFGGKQRKSTNGSDDPSAPPSLQLSQWQYAWTSSQLIRDERFGARSVLVPFVEKDRFKKGHWYTVCVQESAVRCRVCGVIRVSSCSNPSGSTTSELVTVQPYAHIKLEWNKASITDKFSLTSVMTPAPSREGDESALLNVIPADIKVNLTWSDCISKQLQCKRKDVISEFHLKPSDVPRSMGAVSVIGPFKNTDEFMVTISFRLRLSELMARYGGLSPANYQFTVLRQVLQRTRFRNFSTSVHVPFDNGQLISWDSLRTVCQLLESQDQYFTKLADWTTSTTTTSPKAGRIRSTPKPSRRRQQQDEGNPKLKKASQLLGDNENGDRRDKAASKTTTNSTSANSKYRRSLFSCLAAVVLSLLFWCCQ